MLRSKVDWFPRFIACCQYYVPTMPEDEEGSLIQDKATLRRVSVCDGWREMQTILDENGETAFDDLVYMIRICAKLPPTNYNRVDRIIARALKTPSPWFKQELRALLSTY